MTAMPTRLERRFGKLLIANRGEIACRIIRTASRMGLRTVAVFSEADSGAEHVSLADEAIFIGPAPAAESYLRIDRIIEAARRSGAEAIHPGYGFLSENVEFALACQEDGIIFVGPSVEAIRAMGSKSAAKALMQGSGVPLVPGYHGAEQDQATLAAEAGRIGFPVLVKASAGGGGKGMRIAEDAAGLTAAVAAAKREAAAAFGDDHVLIEKYVTRPRHIEVQIFGDTHGNIVSLFERECTLQRRHQKVVEEAPSSSLSEAERERICAAARAAGAAVSYAGAGTVEFVTNDEGFYFIEMNTRLQVEHPITEAVTGIDLVREQIRIASGSPLALTQKDIVIQGHAIECRINAENPVTFVPCPGLVTDYHAPGGLGVRVDSGLYAGYSIPPYYDSMVAKLIVSGGTRNECLMRLRRSLEEFVVGGIDTTIPLHRRIIGEQSFIDGDYDIHWLEKLVGLKK